MTKGGLASWRYACIAALIAGYASLAHYTNSNPQAQGLGALVAVAPLCAVGWGLAWRSIYRWRALAAALLASVLIASSWHHIEAHFALAYVLEECGIYALLGYTFARTLFPGRVPLCTYWADLVHGPLPETVVRYTRNATAAWVVFFALVCCTSVVLYAYAPRTVWSAFSNFFTPPLVVLMFTGEYVVRRIVLPSEHRAGLLQSVRAYLDSQRQPTT
ncbi:MAG TPA: hypothetical protein VII70_01795 [Steroidobacteraceae bacterium]